MAQTMNKTAQMIAKHLMSDKVFADKVAAAAKAKRNK